MPRPMSKERYSGMNPPERMTDLQDGRQYGKLLRHQPKNEQEDSEKEEEESGNESRSNPKYTKKEIVRH